MEKKTAVLRHHLLEFNESKKNILISQLFCFMRLIYLFVTGQTLTKMHGVMAFPV
jgi:hypothetical protein